MSLADHVNKNVEPQDAAREALLVAIAESAVATEKLNTGSRPAALKELAEAYAWVISPSNGH